MQTQEALTNESLAYWQDWYTNQLLPKLTKFNEVQEPGSYTVLLITSKSGLFYDICFYQVLNRVVNKVTKLKVGNEYRKDVYGYVVPEELANKLRECLEVSEAYRKLRTGSINIAEKLSVNGYARIKALSPEKLKQFIDLFS